MRSVTSTNRKNVARAAATIGRAVERSIESLESRRLLSGSLDTGFGAGGKAFAAFGSNDSLAALLAEPSGSVVAAGSSDNRFAIARFTSAGVLDTAFDADGKQATAIGLSAAGNAVARDANGNYVVGGFSLTNFTNNLDFALARYTSSGALDTTFDTDGIVTTNFLAGSADQVFAMAIQSDGKIIAVGASSGDIALARYNANGSLDTTFGSGGRVRTDIGSATSDGANAVVIDSSGRIVVVGTSDGDVVVVRYTSAGALDTAFDSDGKRVIDLGTAEDIGTGVALDSSGNVVVSAESGSNVAVIRLDSAGSLDTSLDGDGIVTTALGAPVSARSVVVQPYDGRIVVVASASDDIKLVRYNTDGSLDSNFGSGGVVTTDLNSGSADAAGALAYFGTTGQRRLVVGATAGTQFAVARYDANIAPVVGTNASPIGVTAGGIRALNSTLLQLTDLDDTNQAGFTYTVVSVPSNGTLRLNGTPLTVGGTFTQAQLNNGEVTYHNTAGTTDSFQFSATDSFGGAVTPSPVTVTFAMTTPTTVWVDDDWDLVTDLGAPGLSSGDTVSDTGAAEWNSAVPSLIFGVDAFSSISAGHAAVSTSGVINVLSGGYADAIDVTKSVQILGPNASVNPNAGTRMAEATVYPTTSDADPDSPTSRAIFYVTAPNVTISGLTIDGDNPSLSGGVSQNGANVDAIEAIGAEDGIANATVTNNIIANLSYAGVFFYNYYNGGAATSGNTVSQNKFENIGYIPYGYGIGVLIYNNAYTSITDNVITQTRVGVQTGNFYQADPGSSALISGNQISASRRGIWNNLSYGSATSYTIQNNTITAVDEAGLSRFDGIMLSSLQGTVSAVVSGNVINVPGSVTQTSVGYQIWNNPTSATVTLQGGSVTGAGYGVWINNYDGYPSSGSNGSASSITVSGVTISGSTIAGVYVKDNPISSHNAVSATLSDGTTIAGGSVGLLVEGAAASVGGLGDTAFSGQSGNYITLANGAMDGLEINGTSASFDGIVGGGTLAQSFAIEDKITHATDSSALGYVRFAANNVFVTPNSGSIQRGIDAASTGDTVHVEAGTYAESVNVNKHVHVVGAGAGITSVQSATTVFNVTASGASASNPVSIQDLTVSGLGTGNGIAVSGSQYLKLENLAVTAANYGLEIGSLDGLEVVNNNFTGNTVAIRVGSNGSLKNAQITGGSLSNNTYGIYNEASTYVTDNPDRFENVTLTGTTLNNNSQRAIYLEKAKNFTLDNVTVSSSTATNAVDINLKYGVHGSISFVGGSYANTGGGTAVHIKGRNDAPSYNANPGSLGTLSFNGTSFTSSGTGNGLSLGNNITAAPTFSGVSFNGTGGGLLNYITAPLASLSVGNSTFASSLATYIANGSAIYVDATNATFGGIHASALTLAQAFAVTDKIFDGVDFSGAGLVRILAGKVFVTPNSFAAPYSTAPSIQRGVDVATAGDTVHVQDGTYDLPASVLLNRPLTLFGQSAGGVTLRPSANIGPMVQVGGGSLDGEASDNVIIDQMNFNGANGSFQAQQGVYVAGSADFDTLTVRNGSFTDLRTQGVAIYGNSSTGQSVDNVVLEGLTFSNNGQNAGGSGDINIYDYNGNVTLKDLLLSGGAPGSRFAIQLRGKGYSATSAANLAPAGTVVFDNVDVSGSYRNYGIFITSFSDVSAMSFDDVKLGGATSSLDGSWGAWLRFDTVGSVPNAAVSLGNTLFRGMTGGNAYTQVFDLEFAPDNSIAFLNADATATQWVIGASTVSAGPTLSLANAFAIEDRVLHYVDKLHPTHGSTYGAYKGFATIRSGNAYVTAQPSVDLAGNGSIQRAVNIVPVSGTVWVNDGTYVENVSINKNLSLLSANGRTVTTIQGVSGVGSLGTLFLTSNTTALKIGSASGNGFTIVGVDNGSPGIENAAVYFQGPHSNAEIRNNEIVANGDAGLLTEYGQAISGFVIDGNVFSGQTFIGTPADNGFTNQFTTPNVPRQLVTMGAGTGTTSTSNITFTNNLITGTAGGVNSGGEQGNTLVTIDALNAVITGNSFSGTTTRYGHSLRARGDNNTISGNTFNSTTMGANTVDLYVNRLNGLIRGNSFGSSAGTAIQVDGAATPTLGGLGVGDTNTISGYTYGIAVTGSTANAQITGNTVTGNTVGVLTAGTSTTTIRANDLTGNSIGVQVAGGTVDLGTQLDPGNNNFTGYTTSSSTSGAIVVSATDAVAGPQGAPGDIPAFGNLWTNPTPSGIEAAVYHDADLTTLRFVDFANLALVSADPDVSTSVEGQTVNYTISFTNDPQVHTLVINWGDGSAPQTVSIAAGVFSVSVPHLYVDDNPTGTPSDNYTISFTLTDSTSASVSGSDIITVQNDAPTIASVVGSTVNENGVATVALTIDDDGALDTFSLTVNWQDGAPADTISGLGLSDSSGTVGSTSYAWTAASRLLVLSHQYLDDNPTGTASDTYAVSLSVTDDDTGTGTGSANVIVNNVAPLVSITGAPTSGNEGDLITLSSTMTDPGTQDTFTYLWSVTKNGNPYGATGSGLGFSFTPDDNGTYIVTLTVTDDDGGVGSDSKSITINNVLPTVSITSLTSTVSEGGTVTLAGTYADDGSADTHVIDIDWDGNGTFDELNVVVSGGAFSLTHTYADDNPTGTSSDTYAVAVRVRDDDGANSATASSNTTVTNVAPTIGITGPTSGQEGSVLNLNWTVTDPGTDTFTYAWSVTKNGNPYGTPGSSATYSFTPDDNGAYVVTLTVTDDDGGVTTTTSSITVTNVAPTVSLTGAASVGEGGTYTLTIGTPVDPGNDSVSTYIVDWGDGSTPDILTEAQLNTLSRTLTHLYNDGLAAPARTITVTLVDEDGVHVGGTKTIDVLNLNPSGTFTGSNSVPAFSTGLVTWILPTDPSPVDAASLRYVYDFNNDGTWDLGNPVYGGVGFVTTPTVVVPASFLTSPGVVTVKSRVLDKDGGYYEQTWNITVTPVTFRVVSLTPTVSGFTVTFNGNVDRTKVNLYGPSASDVVVTLGGNPVRGSLAYDASLDRFTFIATGGPLVNGTYVVTLRSGLDGIQTTAAEQLDGNADGTNGDDYVGSFVVSNPTGARNLRIADFSRGPGQPVNLPATGTGLPITLSEAAGVTSVGPFAIKYDPSKLTISSVTLAAGLPGDWVIAVNYVSPGEVRVTAYGTTALAAGATTIAVINATVPSGSTYGTANRVRIVGIDPITFNETSTILISGTSATLIGDEAVASYNYVGDADKSQGYGGGDAGLIAQASVGLINGFSGYPITDPIIVGDVDGTLGLSGGDATLVAQKSVGLPVAQIPDIPVGPRWLPGTTGSPDGTAILQTPARVRGSAANGATVPVGLLVQSDTDRPTSMMFEVTYDAAKLVIDGRTGVIATDLARSLGITVVANVSTPGTLRIVLFSAQPIHDLAGDLFTMKFTARSARISGRTTVYVRGIDQGTNNLLVERATVVEFLRTSTPVRNPVAPVKDDGETLLAGGVGGASVFSELMI